MAADSSILGRNADGPKSELKTFLLGGKTTDMPEKKLKTTCQSQRRFLTGWREHSYSSQQSKKSRLLVR